MDDHTYGLAIQYGNPGPATYSSANQEWHFARRFRPSQIISYTGYEKQVVAPSAVELPVIRKKDKDTNALLEDYPELISIASSFAREEELSQTIQEAESQFNPQISSVLGFGNAQLSEQVRIRRGRMRTVPIAAFASGQNQNVLSLRLIEAERVVTNLEQDAAFRVPTIGCSRAVDWICNETPIRQIKFADSIENPGDLLAVRLLSSTAIFQPVYHREAQLIDPPELSGLAYSRPQVSHIDPCLVAEIDVSQTGGFTHVDVTFNPWYLKQFAIVDERGHWSIWQLQNIVRLDNGVAPELLHSDFLPCDAADDKGESLTDEVKYDTWGRLEWVRDVNTFIVCGRRNAMLYVLEGTTATSYRIELNWQSSTEWILDVKTCSSQNSLGFILTTTRILCFDFKLADQETQPIRPQFAWLHDRDADDLTLRLTSLTIAEEYYLLLYSRLDSCILVFQVPVDGYEDGIYSMSDPFFIYVPSRPNANGLNTIRYESPIKQILVKEVEQQIYLSNRVTLEHCPRFIKLFMVDGTMAIHEYLYSKPSGLSSADELKVGREALLLSAVSLLSNKKKRKGDRETTVEPSDNDDVDDINRMPLYLSKPIETRPARVSVDFTKIYSLLSRGDSQHLVRPSVSLPEYQSFRDYVEHLIIAVTNSAEEGHSFVHTMLDIIDNPPVLFDIDDSSHELDWFRSRFLPMEPSAETALCFLPLNVSPERSHEQANVIRSFQPFGVLILYEKLVRDWLFKLPRNLPSWIRISKEKLIRQVSIELSLAGTVQIDIPIPDSVSIVSSQPSLPGRRSSTVSQRDSVNGVADFSKEHNMVTHALLDLKTVSPPSMSILLGGATQDILSLWNVGGDPDFFDLERALEAETGERDFGSRSRSRSAQRTRTRSRSRANSASGRSIRSSPVVPSMKFSGSQPQFDSARLPIRSSQFLPSSQITDSMPMTQAERGVFGSRQAGKKSNVKARKKKRAAGF